MFRILFFLKSVFGALTFMIAISRAFVNNVWYIKILSLEDVHKMGEQAVESFSPNAGQRMNSSGNESHDNLSGLPSYGSLEY